MSTSNSEPAPAQTATSSATTISTAPRLYPKVTITYCTQCKWMLRAAYHAQELLSTFSTSLAEVALRPGTGGIYTIHLEAEIINEAGDGVPTIRNVQLWDRKAMGGFPETKILKRLIRDVIDPERGLGHVDRVSGEKDGKGDAASTTGSGPVDVQIEAGHAGTTNAAKKDDTADAVEATPKSVNGLVVVVENSDGNLDVAGNRTKDDDEDRCDCANP